MKFQVGYQNNRKFLDYLLQHKDMISELYFPWGGFTTGRGVSADMEQMAEDLKRFKMVGFKFCLLLNGNCYGSEALSGKFFDKLGNAIMEVMSLFGVSSVTTASPVIAAFLKKNFSFLRIRASVNMEIGSPEAVEYLLDDFDCFYLKREYNYDLARISSMRDFCHAHGKKLYILANSGCLNVCPARTIHENLVAHQHEIAQMDNAVTFHGVCTKFLSAGKNKENILAKSNFIRPEDVHLYENLCDGMKLATRTNFNPLAIVHAYFNGKFRGNLLDLTEPAHSALFPEQIIANKLIPDDYTEFRLNCNKICKNCTYCKEVQKKATITL